MMRSLVTIFSLIPILTASAAEGGEHGEEHKIPEAAHSLLGFITNSFFVAAVVTGLILWFVKGAMQRPQLVPGKKQNFVEFLVEFLYRQTENILGPKVTKQAFPLLATIFLFVTIANWFGLFPGVGTIGWNEHQSGWSSNHIETPLLRPATADLNLTLGIALCSMVIWLIITIREIGVWGFIKHTFAPKGGLSGMLKALLFPIFIIVGLIEIVSIVFRPVSLSLRLFGNVFAGENLLHAMGGLVHTGNALVNFVCSVLLQLPFYFLELLVGVLQGMVFALLNAVFIKLSTTHDEHEEHDDHGHAEKHAH